MKENEEKKDILNKENKKYSEEEKVFLKWKKKKKIKKIRMNK